MTTTRVAPPTRPQLDARCARSASRRCCRRRRTPRPGGAGLGAAPLLRRRAGRAWAASRTCAPTTRASRSPSAPLVVGDVPVLLTSRRRGADVRAFANTCRHRGHELLPEGGDRRPSARSPARTTRGRTTWTATLHVAPGFRGDADVRRDDYGLVALPVETWHGWVFVNATGRRRPPFAEHVGDARRPGRAVRPRSAACSARRHTYEVAANWKIISENYHECYHCPLIHPRALPGLAARRRATTTTCPARGSAARWTCATHAVTMSLDGASDGRSRSPASTRARCSTSGCSPTC